MALIMVILVLTTLIFIVLSLVNSVSMDRRMASDDVTRSKALHYAEAGVAEALARIQAGLGPDPAAANAAERVVQIVLASSPGAAGADTTVLATGQPSGQWMPYSTETSGAGALTIEFLTDEARTKVYHYDKAQTPPLQFTSGSPVYRITSTGTVGTVTRRLVVQATQATALDLMGAVVSGVDIKYTGSGYDCGYDHELTTPYPAGTTGQGGADPCDIHELGSGAVCGTWAAGTFTKTGPSVDTGAPPVVSDTGTFYAGPWEVFGMTQAQFFAWVGPEVSQPATPNGVYYVDNDGIPGNQSCDISYPGATTGSGLLYVDGDLTINNNFHFTGLIYCEGKLTATNQAWVLGSVIARGHSGGRNDITGPNTFLFSRAAVQAIPGAPSSGSKLNVISWQEQ